MAAADVRKDTEKATGEVISDLWQLVRDYAKQETVDPLKALKRFVAYGLAGAIVLSIGLSFISLAVLRLSQDLFGETFDGGLDFVPYLIALAVTLVAAVLAAMAIKRPMRAEEKAR